MPSRGTRGGAGTEGFEKGRRTRPDRACTTKLPRRAMLETGILTKANAVPSSARALNPSSVGAKGSPGAICSYKAAEEIQTHRCRLVSMSRGWAECPEWIIRTKSEFCG